MSNGRAVVRYADLVVENARLRAEVERLRHEQKHDREQLAEWRQLLVESDLVKPTPREALWSLLSYYNAPPMWFERVGWVGGCEHAWGQALCHVLTDAEVDLGNTRESDGGLDFGADPREITDETDPRCDECRGRACHWRDVPAEGEKGR